MGLISGKVFSLFRDNKNKEFIFVIPGGNFGDYLIYKGAEELATKAGVKFKSLSHNEFMDSTCPSSSIIYIHGSGGYVPFHSGTPILELRKALVSHPGTTILGPTTFWNSKEFLDCSIVTDLKHARSKKIFLFARDGVSYTALRECVHQNLTVDIEIDHDTALNVSTSNLNIAKSRKRYSLYAIRQDKEAVKFNRHTLFGVWLDPVKTCHDFDQWVALHAHASKIITNRLHSAILGAILGIPTTLLPNNYHKNRAVWEYSLSRFGVIWADTITAGKITRSIHRVCYHNKLRAMFKWIRSQL